MDLNDSTEEARFRADLRAWLEANAPREMKQSNPEEQRSAIVAWHRQLNEAGYTGLSWPIEVGGKGLGPLEEAILVQEVERLGISSGLNYGFIARAMLLFATPEQQRRYLPGLLSGSEFWCQGFSEPDAGSDLASLRTRAVADPTIGDTGGYRITGQKTWTSGAQFADLCLCLVRTGEIEDRHRGISAVIIDMKSPGIDIRPIRTIRGDTEFCEVFFEDTPVSNENLVGQPGEGWNYALVTLTYERGPADIGFVSKYLSMVQRLRKEAALRGLGTDNAVQREISRVAAGVEVLRLHVLRSLSMRLDRAPGAEGSVDKLLMARVEQDLLHVAMNLFGSEALVDDRDHWFSDYLYSRASTIYGGSAQIQRNVLAERCLGLPR
jgi:alkylation response protein AidB-like acyl-CoA dehydrogenase